MKVNSTMRIGPWPGLAGALVLTSISACGPANVPGDSESGAEEVSAFVFPDSPPDAPMPEIPPAPDTYRPTAAGAPSTDIWVGNLVRSGAELVVEGLVNATDRDGYDNQPSFSSDGDAIFYVAVFDTTQTEAYRFDVGTGTRTRLTHTADASEFSPTPIPRQEAFSAIHETRGKQYLWRYALDGSELGPIFATAEPVGYHAWADEQLVAMFILGDPPTLQVGDAVTGEIRVIAERPGRSIHRIPGTNAISFVRKASAEEWWIERLDPITGQTERLTRTLPGREDYAWTDAGELLMGDGPVLHLWTAQGGWTELQDFSQDGVGDISRIAVSPDGATIAIVSSRGGA